MKHLRQFAAGLLEGLLQPTPTSLLVILLTIVVIVFAFTPRIFSLLPHEYFIARPRMLDVQASQKALQLRSGSKDQLSVILLGASSLQEALLGEDTMTQRLSNRLDRIVNVKKITARGIKLFDLLRFVDQIPLAYKGIVLVCVSTEKFEDPGNSLDRFPLASPLYSEQIKKFGVSPALKTGIFLIDHYRFFSSRSRLFVRALVFGPVRPVSYFKDGLKLSELNREKIRVIERKKSKLPHLYLKYAPQNYRILSLLFSTIEKRGMHGVYLHPPRNLEFLLPLYKSIDKSDYLDRLDHDVAEFAENSGITYWNLNNKISLNYDDFRDSSHISNMAARTRYTEMLLDKLYHLIQVQFKREG